MAEEKKTKSEEKVSKGKTETKKLEDYKTMGAVVKEEEKKSEEKKKEVKKDDKGEVKTEKVEEKKSVVEQAKEKVEAAEEKKPVESKQDSKKKPADKKKELKVELDREYIVPLRKGFLKVPRYRRAKKAIRVLKEFIAKHMKVEDRDLNKVKVNIYLNNEIWFKGIKKPLHKIKVRAIKKSDGNVYVELAEIPEKVKFDMARHAKRAAGVKAITKKPVKEEKTETEEEKKDESEKEKSSVEAGLMKQEVLAKTAKHTSGGKHAKITSPVRKALKK